MNGIEASETLKFLLKRPTDTSQAIVVDETDDETPIIVPLFFNGVMNYFSCQKPTRAKFEDGDVPRIDFTVMAPDWEPSYWKLC